MAHYNQQNFILTMLDIVATKHSIIVNVGSANVNGSGFKYENQIDVDLIVADGVNVVADASNLPISCNSTDVYVSAECYEHNPSWKQSIHEAIRILKDDGIALLTIASLLRYEHGTQRTTPQASPGTNGLGWNYYKNLFHNEIKNEFKKASVKYFCKSYYNYYSADLYVIFVKNPTREKVAKINMALQSIESKNTLVYDSENWLKPLKLALKIILSLLSRSVGYNITNELLYILKKIKIKK
jgi:SAM-dependent methyltransferase